MTLFDHVVALLNAQGVAHALIGAAALAAHGVARSTFDIDLLTTDLRVLGRELWTALDAEGATVDIRRGDSEDPLTGVIRIETTGDRPVDIILGTHGWQTRAVELADHGRDGAPVVRNAEPPPARRFPFWNRLPARMARHRAPKSGNLRWTIDFSWRSCT